MFGAFLSIRYSLENDSNLTEIGYFVSRLQTSVSNNLALAKNNESSDKGEVSEMTKAKSESNNQCQINYSNINTNSIYDLFVTLGKDPSFDNRANVASILKIMNYQGTADQNTKLIKLIKGGQLCTLANAR